MIVCIDTNVVFQGRSPAHRFFPIIDACVAGRLHWAVSNRILLEYCEVITETSGVIACRKFERLMEHMAVTTGTLTKVEPHYQFRVIVSDPDDNAFTDCAITAHADYIITEDRHFAPLANAGYRPQPIAPLEFIVRHPQIFR